MLHCFVCSGEARRKRSLQRLRLLLFLFGGKELDRTTIPTFAVFFVSITLHTRTRVFVQYRREFQRNFQHNRNGSWRGSECRCLFWLQQLLSYFFTRQLSGIPGFMRAHFNSNDTLWA